jgi:DNA topoisomerase-1
VQLGDSETEKPQFVSLQKGQSIFTITLEEALDLFRTALPYTLGELDGKEIVVGEGKFGPYLRYGNDFISIPKQIDPHHIQMEQAIELIGKHNQQQLPLHTWGDVQVLNGRYGAYIKAPTGNYKIPRQVNVDTMTEEECRAIIANSEPTGKAKKASSKKTK